MRKIISYSVGEVVPYINWLYFFHAWGLKPTQQEERLKLRADADRMLQVLDTRYRTYAVFLVDEANSDGDDLIIGETRVPLLRQQESQTAGMPNLCLADFVRPLSSGVKDMAGVFASSVDIAMEKDFAADDYERMLVQILADRLAEATTELMHLQVRKNYWGYAPDENLSMDQLHSEEYQGIRPAVGYPSLPDVSLNFVLDSMITMKDIGIRLTESGAMKPHASVSGLMFSHPKAHYFDLGKIGEDQLRDYARRRGLPLEVMRHFLQSSLMK